MGVTCGVFEEPCVPLGPQKAGVGPGEEHNSSHYREQTLETVGTEQQGLT
jgi:hypothetical protein